MPPRSSPDAAPSSDHPSPPESRPEAQHRRLPLALKLGYAGFLALLTPVYWVVHGPVNFLWFSNIALFLTCVAVWRESALLASMMALSVVFFELGWTLGFFTRLFTGVELFGLTGYMFDPSLSLFVRGLSLYHLALPPLLIWLMYRLGYDRRALFAQTGLAWTVLILVFFVSDPEGNENWVFGPGEDGEPQDFMPAPLWLAMLMAAFPLLVYLPCHLLFRSWFGPAGRFRHRDAA